MKSYEDIASFAEQARIALLDYDTFLEKSERC
jgi:hypothetical protein